MSASYCTTLVNCYTISSCSAQCHQAIVQYLELLHNSNYLLHDCEYLSVLVFPAGHMGLQALGHGLRLSNSFSDFSVCTHSNTHKEVPVCHTPILPLPTLRHSTCQSKDLSKACYILLDESAALCVDGVL